MKEYKVVFRTDKMWFYAVLDGIVSEDTAYIILAYLISSGIKDCRIEVSELEEN